MNKITIAVGALTAISLLSLGYITHTINNQLNSILNVVDYHSGIVCNKLFDLIAIQQHLSRADLNENYNLIENIAKYNEGCAGGEFEVTPTELYHIFETKSLANKNARYGFFELENKEFAILFLGYVD